MKYTLLLPALAISATGLLPAGPTTRAADYTAALAQAKASGNDLVVLQRGSDWNRLGETLYQNVWLQPEFLTALGDGFVLTTVDRQEQPGAPALGSGEDAGLITRFNAAVAPEARLPDNTITALKAESGATYQRREDGAYLVNDPKNEHNPATDVLTFTVSAPVGGCLLRLDFPPAATLPNGCAGRASNGNFFLNEVELTAGDQPVKLSRAWASATEGAGGAAQTIDGIKDQPANGWNAAAHVRQPRTLILALETPVRAATSIKVTLTSKTPWPQHVPGCLRAAVLADAQLAAAVVRIADATAIAANNAAFSWWDGGICPRIALLDSEGRAIAAESKPRADLTPSTLAARIKEFRAKRETRDEFLAKAEKVQGAEKAEFLRQALDSLGIFNWPGNGNCYQPIHAKIKEADPQDVSGVTRWLGFGGDPKGGVPWAKPAWNEAIDTQGGKRVLTDADYQEALARVDKELADPRNKILPKENIQRMMVAKFHIYRSWKGHEEERFRIQQEIADFDPTTFWGIGGTGYCGMYGKSATPFLTYGWKPTQVKSGLNTWRLTDTAYFFDHPGKYKISLTHAGGADKVKIKRLALLDGTAVLAEARPDTDLGPGPLAKLEVVFDCNAWQEKHPYIFLTELEAADGHSDSSGTFAIEPWFEEPAATPAATDYAKVLRDLRQKLNTACMTNPGALDQVLATDSIRRDLALHELLRRCGADRLTKLAAAHGGPAFLKAFTGDLPWLESFLANDETPWPQALDNLRFLCANAPAADIANPLYRRLATAMALAAGELNRYRLLDRYQAIIRTHRAGLLHASFDQLTIREMRWAVLLSGTAVDYEFMVDATQVRVADYLGTCWGIAYIDPNVYGYSVQGWGYTDPWTHHYGTGTGDRPFRVQRHVGGVCGTLSGFGAATAKAHGVMSVTVGQPGHCAYVVRIGQEWPTGYDVSGPETNGASVFEGTGFPTMHRLYEVIHADPAAYLKAARLAWAAHVMQDVRRAFVRILPGLKYHLYQLPGGNLSELPKLKPVKSGDADSFHLAAVLPPDTNNFGIVWEGQLEISGDGPLQVQLQSDDASRLTVGNQDISCNQPAATVKLRPGTYPVRLEYGQAGGAYSLAVTWTGLSEWSTQWSGAFGQAIAAQPINYPLWLDCIKALEATPDTPPAAWIKLIDGLANAFAPYHEAGWALINRCYAKVAPTLTPPDRLALLLKCHQRLTQANAPKFMGYNFGAVLNVHADSLGEPQLALEFLGRLLKIHHAADPTQNRVFGDVMNWGNARFGGTPATSAAYAKTIGTFFTSLGKDADSNQMRTQITAGIRKASETADVPAYQLWTTMAAKLLPPIQPGDIHLNPQQLAEPPKVTPFPGVLLSKEGLLQTSSACQYDRPLTYPAILAGPGPGYFDTNNEPKPWAQIVLAGDAEISGIVLVNRYELPPVSEEFLWAAPLKVQTSLDGKTWTDVATCDQAALVMRIDLAGKVPRARYLRIERQVADPAKPPRLHFRNFLIYGKKLY